MSNFKNSNKQAPKKSYKGKSQNKKFQKGAMVDKGDSSSNYRPKSINDMSWYDHHPELTQAVARLPYPYRPGMTIKGVNAYVISQNTKTATKTGNEGLTIPGILTLNFFPSVGVSNKSTDPASIAAREIYAKVRAKFSGTLVADAPDFLIYSMAIDSIYAYIAMLKRLYYSINSYTAQNFNLPERLVYAMGFNTAQFNALRQRKVELGAIIDTLSLDANKYTLPGVMDIFKRHYWLNSNVYTDAPTAASQLYMFKQLGYYKFDLDAESAGKLSMVEFKPTGNDILKYLLEFGASMLNALNDSEDAYTINGYLQRAYEGESVFKSEMVNSSQVLQPVYVPEVLAQIENAQCCMPEYFAKTIMDTKPTYLFDITQNVTTNAIIHNPKVTYNGTGDNLAPIMGDVSILNLRKDNPDVEDNIIATRLHSRGTFNGTENSITIRCGTEAMMYFEYYGGTPTDPDTSFIFTNFINFTEDASKGAVYSGSQTQRIGVMSYFSQHPIMWLIATINTKYCMIPLCDFDNATSVTDAELDEMDRVCLYSLLNAF